MEGETDLQALLAGMEPVLNDGLFVFCTVKEIPPALSGQTIGIFREKEGITLILQKELADSVPLVYSHTNAWITLSIHSALEAVGFTAAFSKALAEKGISCNVVAAFHHDHIFVPAEAAHRAMQTLRHLSTHF